MSGPVAMAVVVVERPARVLVVVGGLVAVPAVGRPVVRGTEPSTAVWVSLAVLVLSFSSAPGVARVVVVKDVGCGCDRQLIWPTC